MRATPLTSADRFVLLVGLASLLDRPCLQGLCVRVSWKTNPCWTLKGEKSRRHPQGGAEAAAALHACVCQRLSHLHGPAICGTPYVYPRRNRADLSLALPRRCL